MRAFARAVRPLRAAVPRFHSFAAGAWPEEVLGRECRTFPAVAADIEVLGDPTAYYEAILDGIRSSRRRVTLAALYLGTGPMEQRVMEELRAACARHPSLHVRVLFDHSRGTRGGGHSTAAMFNRLVSEFPAQVHASLLLMPQLRRRWTARLPTRLNEGIAVQHAKAYVFDDTLLLSGANMSNDYFTNRQDRCWRFHDNPGLAAHFHDLVDRVAPFSHSVRPASWVPIAEFPDASSAAPAVLRRFGAALADWARPAGAAPSADARTADTTVHLAANCAPLGVSQDTDVTQQLLAHALASGCAVHLATGYFNLPRSLRSLLAGGSLAPGASARLLTAHPSANGFFTATRSPAGALPLAYSRIEEDFVRQCARRGVADRVSVSEWRRKGWTFHAKGLWVASTADEDPFLVTLGSPNFGRRSAERDLEAQAFVTTRSPDLSRRAGEECDQLFADSEPVGPDTFRDPSRRCRLYGGYTHGYWVEAARRAIAAAM